MRRRPKDSKLVTNGRLRAVVRTKLRKNWSPEQISWWLEKRYPDDSSMQVSHETIYKTLFIQARGALKKELCQHLRSQRKFRHARRKTGQRGPLKDAVSIRERPPEVEDRAVPGHWEGDLLAGGNQSQIATLVERKSRFVLLVRIPSKDSEIVAKALAKAIKNLPRALAKTLTWDRGTELAAHQKLAMDANIKVFFCDPYSPWQRGSNENTNGLLRQYFPKGMDLSGVSQAQLNRVANELNGRPRKTLNFDNPAEVYAQDVALTA